MRARWFALLGIIFIVIGFIIPVALYSHDVSNASGWGGILWIIVAPAIYAPILIPFWVVAFIFFIVAIWKWKNRR